MQYVNGHIPVHKLQKLVVNYFVSTLLSNLGFIPLIAWLKILLESRKLFFELLKKTTLVLYFYMVSNIPSCLSFIYVWLVFLNNLEQ